MIGAALLIHLLGSYVLQLSHATGFGAYNARYFLPSIGTIVAILVAGLVATRWWPASVTLVTSVFLGANLVAMLAFGAERRGDELAVSRALTEIATQAAANGIPWEVPAGGIILAALGLVALAASAFAASARAVRTTTPPPQ